MPPRFAYWTILIDDNPTAFRARDAEELLPTLQSTQTQEYQRRHEMVFRRPIVELAGGRDRGAPTPTGFRGKTRLRLAAGRKA